MPVSDDLNELNNLPFLGVRPLDVTVTNGLITTHLTEHTVSDTVSIKNTHRLPLYNTPAVLRPHPSPPHLFESLGLTAQHLPLV